jgi:aspartyl protease family protein
MLLVTSALSLGLGRHALPALQVGDLFWLALLLASGAFATLALTGSRSRPIAAGAKVVPCLAVAIVAALGYGHRSEIGELARRSWLASARPCATVAISPDGGYRIDAMVGGTALRFLVDTGASDVVFTLDDARRLGIDPTELDFSERVMTANGVVSAAPVKLATLSIGPITVHDLDALISDGEQDVSLLGMRFIQSLAEVTIKDGVLTIRQ